MSDAFIAAFQDDKRISLAKAKEILGLENARSTEYIKVVSRFSGLKGIDLKVPAQSVFGLLGLTELVKQL